MLANQQPAETKTVREFVTTPVSVFFNINKTNIGPGQPARQHARAVTHDGRRIGAIPDKAANVMSTGAEVLCTGDYSCLMNIGGALSRVNSGVRIMHIAEILASTKEAPFEGHVSFQPSRESVKL